MNISVDVALERVPDLQWERMAASLLSRLRPSRGLALAGLAVVGQSGYPLKMENLCLRDVSPLAWNAFAPAESHPW